MMSMSHGCLLDLLKLQDEDGRCARDQQDEGRGSTLQHYDFLFDRTQCSLQSSLLAPMASTAKSSTNENVKLSYYRHRAPISTRWSDNDQYGHVNNSIYYHYFDATANSYLLLHCGLNPQSTTSEDIKAGGPIGLVISSGCRYWKPIEFPSPLVGALTIGALGNSSVTYHLAVFSQVDVEEHGDQAEAAATGFLTHVFVDPISRRPSKMTKKCRAGLLAIASEQVESAEKEKELKHGSKL